MNRPSAWIGLLLVVVGLVWAGQGAGVIGGSAMSGSTFWLVVGLVLVVLGGGLVANAVRSRA